MTSTALHDLAANGVSIWLDDLSRERLTSGNLQQLIDDKGVVGVTTNPSIFQAALSEGHAYDAQVRELADAGKTVDEAVFALTTQDVRDACDLFLPVYEATGGQDGRVSIEVDPRLAHDTVRTIEEAKALAAAVDRPNVLIKIPATIEGLPAITEVMGAGISVNVTLIFALARYPARVNPSIYFTTDRTTIGLWHFDEGSATVLRDSSPQSRNGTSTNGGQSATSAWIGAPRACRSREWGPRAGVGGGTVVLGVGAAREIAGRRASLVAAGLAALLPNLWTNDVALGAETPAQFAVALVLLLCARLRALSGPHVTDRFLIRASVLGGACALAALTRSELALLVPLVLVPAVVGARVPTQIGRAHV